MTTGTNRGITPRTLIIAVTMLSLTLSFGLSAVWFATVPGSDRFEPAVQTLGLLAGITGVIAERRAGALERRDQALASVRTELERNGEVLARFAAARASGPRREIYPRLYTSAVDDTLSSTALLSRDEGLGKALHLWRDEARTFNQRLSIAELLAFVNGSEEVLHDLHDALHASNGPVQDIRADLDDVLSSMPAPERR